MKVTTRKLAELVTAARVINPAVAVNIRAVIVPGNKALTFVGYVTVGGVEYTLAATNGKVKPFGDVDDLLKVVALAAPITSGAYTISVETGVELAASIPVDLVKAAASQVVKLQRSKTAQEAAIVHLDAQLDLMAGWDSGNALQAARFAETTEQRAVVAADLAVIIAEIDRLTP